MDYTIIDAHAHLWLRQDTVVDGFPIRTLDKGRSLFMGEIRQMVPPFMMDGVNSAEVFLSNMDYAQVAAAVITQEFIDGIQNDYLSERIVMRSDIPANKPPKLINSGERGCAETVLFPHNLFI